MASQLQEYQKVKAQKRASELKRISDIDNLKKKEEADRRLYGSELRQKLQEMRAEKANRETGMNSMLRASDNFFKVAKLDKFKSGQATIEEELKSTD